MPWEPDAETIAASDRLRHHPYNGGGPWDATSCVEQLLPHAERLRQMIRRVFPAIHISRETGRCRPWQRHDRSGRPLGQPVNNLHSVGRALDCMVPVLSGDDGAALANWAVQHAATLGIQLVIWDDKQWQGSSPAARRWTDYVSTNPADNTLQHRDHVHIEVTADPFPGLQDTMPDPSPAQGPGFGDDAPGFLSFGSVTPAAVPVGSPPSAPPSPSDRVETQESPSDSMGWILIGLALSFAYAAARHRSR